MAVAPPIVPGSYIIFLGNFSTAWFVCDNGGLNDSGNLLFLDL